MNWWFFSGFFGRLQWDSKMCKGGLEILGHGIEIKMFCQVITIITICRWSQEVIESALIGKLGYQHMNVCELKINYS